LPEVLEERTNATDDIFSMSSKSNFNFNHPNNLRKGKRIR